MAFKDKLKELCSVERDRLTAAEVCIDELLTTMNRHGVGCSDPIYVACAELSSELHKMLTSTDGLAARRDRLIRVRDALDVAFPMTDADRHQ